VQALFSDRGWVWKVAAALLAFSWCCHDSQRALSKLHAQAEDAALKPERHLGMECYAWAHTVLSADSSGFEIRTKAGPVRVEGLRAEPGQVVSVRGRVAGPRLIRADRLHVNDGYAWKRGLNYALSIIVVLAVAASFRRRWRCSAREGVLRERT
jgi:hypothetical protein